MPPLLLLFHPNPRQTLTHRRWLIEIPTGKQVLLAAQDGMLFVRFVAVLESALAVHVLPILNWHERRQGKVGREAGLEQTTAVVGGGNLTTHAGAASVLQKEGARRDDAAIAELSAAIDHCSDTLKTAACLMSLNE